LKQIEEPEDKQVTIARFPLKDVMEDVANVTLRQMRGLG
jgi:hypothetical protein